MSAFYEHHKDSIRFGYRCFDRILLNGLIQPRWTAKNPPEAIRDIMADIS
jgi:hypothetical protein